MAAVPSLSRLELQKMRPIYQLALLLFFAVNFCSLRAEAQDVANKSLSVNIGVVLDFDSIIGKVSNTCISMALSDFYAIHNNYTSRLVIHSRDSNNDFTAAFAALGLMKNLEVLAIIGPQASGETRFVADMGDNAKVPIVSFTARSPSLSSTRTPYFVRTGQNDAAQVNAIAAIVQAFGWREVVPIYEDSEYGKGVIPYLIDALQEVEAKVPFRSVIPTSAIDDKIRGELYKLMTMQTRVFVVHMSYSLGARLFLLAKEVGMMSEDYSWIVTDGISDLLESLDSTVIDAMQGVLGVKTYLPKSKKHEAFTIRWKQKFRRENPDLEKAELSSFGLWAYDTVWALAMAVEQISGSITGSFRFKKNLAGNSTDLEALGVSPVGPNLLKAILSTRFNGLSGEFRLVDGQLQLSAFHIVNVVGKGWRDIGFWTPAAGISRNLNPDNMSKNYSVSKNNLKAIIWPGESTVVPRGWVILPSSGKKLRIGVPVKTGFSEFVTVKQNPDSNGATVEGFCIDVFDSVMKALPYGVPYEFVPYQNSTKQAAGTYNELVNQVYLKNFDAAIGDLTIIANRSLYVDFTLPFTESGVSMVVPVKNDRSSNAWVFLEPLTNELWVISGVFLMFMGIVVWILEHRINPEFRGHPSEQLGTICYFAFSTMVFAHPIWWDNYGDSTPELKKLAIRILSLTCSATCCERNWSTFEQIHSKRRNRLEQQRLNALVYVKYNLNLGARYEKRKVVQGLDPICLSDMDSDDEWITEREDPTLPTDISWMDIRDFFVDEEGESETTTSRSKARGPRNLTIRRGRAPVNVDDDEESEGVDVGDDEEGGGDSIASDYGSDSFDLEDDGGHDV